MNKKIVGFLFAIVSIVMISFSSCNEKGALHSSGNNIEFDTLMVTETNHLENDTTRPFCKLSIQFVYPVSAGKVNLDSLQKLFIESVLGHSYVAYAPEEALKAYSENYKKNYKFDAEAFVRDVAELDSIDELEPALTAEYSNEDDHKRRNGEFYTYNEELGNTIHFNNNNVVSFQVKQKSNKGGSQAFESFKNYTISLKTGKILTENEIFKAGYDVQLRTLFTNALLDQNNVSTSDELNDLGYFGVEEIMPNNNFLVDDKGITYIFNKGEYSALPLDAPVIVLSYDILRPLLRENTVVSKLAGI